MPALPFPYSDLLPMPAPSAALCDTLCPVCEGLGYLESFDPMLSERCPECFGRGSLEVCDGCGERPEVTGGVERCGCAPAATCEVCEQPAETEEGLCRSCFRKGIEKVLEEEDPELAHYYYLRDFDLPSSVIEQEMALARENGWIQ